MQEFFKKSPIILTLLFAIPLLLVFSYVYKLNIDQLTIYVFLVFLSFLYPRFLYDSGDKEVISRVKKYHLKNCSIYDESWTLKNLFIILSLVFIAIDCSLTFFGILFMGYSMEGNEIFSHMISQYGLIPTLILRALLGALISFLFISINEKGKKNEAAEKKLLRYSTYLILIHSLLYIVLSGWIMFFAYICFYGNGLQYQAASLFMYSSILFLSYKYYRMLKETLLSPVLTKINEENSVVRLFSGSLRRRTKS